MNFFNTKKKQEAARQKDEQEQAQTRFYVSLIEEAEKAEEKGRAAGRQLSNRVTQIERVRAVPAEELTVEDFEILVNADYLLSLGIEAEIIEWSDAQEAWQKAESIAQQYWGRSDRRTQQKITEIAARIKTLQGHQATLRERIRRSEAARN